MEFGKSICVGSESPCEQKKSLLFYQIAKEEKKNNSFSQVITAMVGT